MTKRQWRWATVIVDASFCPQTKLATWAAWIRMDGAPKTQKVAAFRDTVASSTEAELRAALNGLYLAQKMGAEAVQLQSDCMAVANALDDPCRAVLFTRRMEAAGITGLRMVKLKHVKGHTNGDDARHWCNNWCDNAARNKLREIRQETV